MLKKLTVIFLSVFCIQNFANETSASGTSGDRDGTLELLQATVKALEGIGAEKELRPIQKRMITLSRMSKFGTGNGSFSNLRELHLEILTEEQRQNVRRKKPCSSCFTRCYKKFANLFKKSE